MGVTRVTGRSARLLWILGMLGMGLILSACSGGNEPGNGQTALLQEVTGVFQTSREARQAPEINVTRALLDSLTVPSLEVVSESRDQTAYLIPGSRRGPVTVWRTTDGVQLVLRDGLITGSRGLGNDLASSDFAATLASLSRGQGSTTRTLYLRNDVGGQETLVLSCLVEDRGLVSLDVVEVSFTTRHLRERCETSVGPIVQDYWIEPNGRFRQSRQWLGPKIGYLRLRLLKA